MPAHRLRRLVVLGLGALLLLASTALADDKPKIAVLGLEVQTSNGAPDQETTKIARNLTDGLRQRALSGAGQYQMAPNSERELIDEKLMASCLDEKPACMAQIGAGLKADFLLYGRIDKNNKCGDGYQITLKLLDVAKAAEVSPPTPWKQCISANAASNNPKQWGEKTYAKVVGDDSGTTASSSNNSNTTTTTTVVTPPEKPAKKSNGWKTGAYVSGTVAVVTGLAFIGSAVLVQSVDGGQKCDVDDTTGKLTDKRFACTHGDQLSATTYGAGITAAAAAVFTGVAFYMSSRSKERSTQAAGKPPKKRFAVTPVVTPGGGGATVRIDW